MLRLSKQANEEIKRLEDARNRNFVQEVDKGREVEHLDAIAFWEATARHWQKRASFLDGVADRERRATAAAVTEMEIQRVASHHWQQMAEQCHKDTMSAERRSDSMGEILDALKQGYVIEPFPGRATWWTMDTDTLAEIAKDAREWQIRESEKPPVYMGKGEGEPFTMGGQEFKPEDAPEKWIVWEWNYQPADLNDDDTVEIHAYNGDRNVLTVAVVDWAQVEKYRVVEPQEPTKAEVEAEELIGLANHVRSAINGLPAEWHPWANEIHDRIRQVAHRLNQK